MKYLTGKDYPSLCRKCRSAIDMAHTAILTESASMVYINDAEGPVMLVYDCGELCGGHWCKSHPSPLREEARSQYHCVPQWSIFMVKEDWKNKIRYVLPICTSFEDWPVQGGIFDTMAELLGWDLVPNSQSAVGGFYLRPNLDIALECHPWGHWPSAYLPWVALSILPATNITKWEAW